MTKILTSCLAISLTVTLASASTLWTGNVNTALTNAGNWDNGLPNSAGNLGTIPNGAGTVNHSFNLTGYHIIQNGGSFTASVANTLSDGSWTLNDGGTYTPNVNAVLQGADNGSQSFTMTGGTYGVSQLTMAGGTNRTATWNQSGGVATATSTVFLNAGADMTLSNGTFNANSDVRFAAGTLTVSGGNLNVTGSFGRDANIFLNGGTIDVGSLSTFTGFNMTLGGSTAGSLTAGSLNGAFEVTNRNFNWLAGSQMTFTVTATTDWAETEWNAGRMKFNGQDESTLGDWSTVNGTIFNYDGGTNTLSLVPEPSPFALLGLGMSALVICRRRRGA